MNAFIKRKHIVRNVIFGCFVFIIAITTAEVGVRLVTVPPSRLKPLRLTGVLIPHPTRGYAYRPNFRGYVRRAGRTIPIYVNALGFRDRPIEKKAAE